MSENPTLSSPDDLESLVDEYIERDMLPDDVADEVATLRADGQVREAADLILQTRRDQNR